MIIENLKIHWRNWRHRKTGRAYRTIIEAMQDDPEYAQIWISNIAMTIYDSTRPKCVCHIIQPGIGTEHWRDCEIHQANTIPLRFECREMSIEQANYIAEKLMKHLFQVSVSERPFTKSP